MRFLLLRHCAVCYENFVILSILDRKHSLSFSTPFHLSLRSTVPPRVGESDHTFRMASIAFTPREWVNPITVVSRLFWLEEGRGLISVWRFAAGLPSYYMHSKISCRWNSLEKSQGSLKNMFFRSNSPSLTELEICSEFQ